MITNIGLHKVTNASLENPIVDQLFENGEKALVLYSDTPWGDGNVKYWATINKRMTGQEITPLKYSQIIDRIIDLAVNHVDGWIFIETGQRWEKETIEDLEKHFYKIKSTVRYYGNGSKLWPNILIGCVTNPSYSEPDFSSLGDLLDLKMVTAQRK